MKARSMLDRPEAMPVCVAFLEGEGSRGGGGTWGIAAVCEQEAQRAGSTPPSRKPWSPPDLTQHLPQHPDHPPTQHPAQPNAQHFPTHPPITSPTTCSKPTPSPTQGHASDGGGGHGGAKQQLAQQVRGALDHTGHTLCRGGGRVCSATKHHLGLNRARQGVIRV